MRRSLSLSLQLPWASSVRLTHFQLCSYTSLMRFTFYCIHYAAPNWWQQQAFDAHPKANTQAHTHTRAHSQTKENFRFQSRNFIQLSKLKLQLYFFWVLRQLQAWLKPVSQQKLLRPVIDSRAQLKYYAYAVWASFGNAPCHFAAAAARLHAAELCMLHGSHPKTDIINTHMFIVCVCMCVCVTLCKLSCWFLASQRVIVRQVWSFSNCTCQFSPQAACFAHSNDVLTDYYQIFAYAIKISYFPLTD